MTHDPLCPNRKVMADFPSEIECGSCTFIAKVRDDERSRIADAVFDNMVSHPYEYPSDYAQADRKWIKAGCPTDAIDALRGEA